MITDDVSIQDQPEKNPAVAYALWFFLGAFGAHRFYFSKTGSGLAMAGLTVASVLLSPIFIGLLGFPVIVGWWLFDAFQIGKWVHPEDNANDATQIHPAINEQPVAQPRVEPQHQAA